MKKKNQKPYFECWYFKEQAEDDICIFVPKFFYDEEGRATASLDMRLSDRHWHFEFPHPVNMNLRGSLFLVLGKCVFTEVCMHLDIDEPGLTIKGDIYFDHEFGGGRVSRRRKIWALEQSLSGELIVNGRKISFDGGKGYLEELRGLQAEGGQEENPGFWSQCSWFGDKAFRIVCGGSARRCFASIDQDGYQIRMAWWKGAKTEYMAEDGFRLRQGRYVLEGWRSEESQISGGEQTVRYRLTHRGDVLFDEISQRAVYLCQSYPDV